jgi:hypothetical protein
MKLKNEQFANSKLVSGFGELVFDEKGILSVELKVDDLKALSELDGFEIVTEKAKEPKKEEKPKEEVKESDKDTEEAPKRSKRKSSEK